MSYSDFREGCAAVQDQWECPECDSIDQAEEYTLQRFRLETRDWIDVETERDIDDLPKQRHEPGYRVVRGDDDCDCRTCDAESLEDCTCIIDALRAVHQGLIPITHGGNHADTQFKP